MKTPLRSRNIYERSLEYIPWGASTCSKRPALLPDEPAVILKGKGGRVWDADGNEYIDFRNALGPVTLGYCHPYVDAAIKEQLDNGIIFGHSHPLEGEIAELFCKVVPCAEKARFLKTGGEAAAATIRMARACTGRKKIIQVGYNGWLNSIGAGANLLPRQNSRQEIPGVPHEISSLFHVCEWDCIEDMKNVFEKYPSEVAAVIIACKYSEMDKAERFLPNVRKLCDDNGALLIMDEIVTGFRIAIGGAHEYFNVKPDLAVFAKGVANGMPLAIYSGRRECMDILDECIVSSTYGGETLSLAAAKATINTYLNENVIDYLWKTGESLWTRLNGLFKERGVGIEVKGFWPCPDFIAEEKETLDSFFRAAYRNGVSLYRVSYVNFSHKKQDIDEALERLQNAIKEI